MFGCCAAAAGLLTIITARRFAGAPRPPRPPRQAAATGAGVALLAPTSSALAIDGAWFPTDSMHAARSSHTATALADGRVLVAGGYGGTTRASAERSDPVTGTWSETGPSARSGDPVDLANRTALEDAATAPPLGLPLIRNRQLVFAGARNATGDLCSDPVRLTVPLRQRANGTHAPDRRTFRLRTLTGDRLDTDSLILTCHPRP